jgi:DNA-binding transcriptional regulator LsrR (DeoR family)
MWRDVVIAAVVMAAVHANLAIVGVGDTMPTSYGIVRALLSMEMMW